MMERQRKGLSERRAFLSSFCVQKGSFFMGALKKGEGMKVANLFSDLCLIFLTCDMVVTCIEMDSGTLKVTSNTHYF